MVLFCSTVCVYVYQICEGKFADYNNGSFSWLGEKVKDRPIPGPGFLSVHKFSCPDDLYKQLKPRRCDTIIHCAPPAPLRVVDTS